MDAGELSGSCPLCRDRHAGGCTVLSAMSIVLFEINEYTSPEDLAAAEEAYARAAAHVADHYDA
jgi:hypothetical protein